jgi:hypothetical protein
VRRDRGGGGECCEVFRRCEDQAGAAHGIVSLAARQAHRPVEADAVAVHAHATLGAFAVDARIGLTRFGRAAPADLRMLHEAAFGDGGALDVCLAGNAVVRQEGAGANSDCVRQRAAPVDQFAGVRQRSAVQQTGQRITAHRYPARW